MNIETLKKDGIRFSYSRYAVFPQIPYVQDVLYVLQLTDEKHKRGNYGPEGAGNWPEYIANLMLVAAAVAGKVLFMEHYDEAQAQARKIIAEAIMDLCPPEAKCLFNSAFVSAQEEFTGVPAPSRTASRDMILRTCGCAECKRTIRDGNSNTNKSIKKPPKHGCFFHQNCVKKPP